MLTLRRSKEKKQGTYFKICLTYFKISQTYFLPPENPFENCAEKADKQGQAARLLFVCIIICAFRLCRKVQKQRAANPGEDVSALTYS